jgi:hypothetical protein
MKKQLASIAAVALLAVTSQASVTINFNLGTMYSGTTTDSPAFPVGGRVNLLALNSGSWSDLDLVNTFSNLTNSYAPAGATLAASIFNDDVGGPGITGGAFVFDYDTPAGFGAGDQLLVVAYPTLTSLNSVPGLGTPGFFFRSSFADPVDGSDMLWLGPADGGTYTLAALDLMTGGTYPNTQFTSGVGAQATSGIGITGGGFTTVPEPSTYALLGLAGLALGGYAARRRRRA